MPAMTHILTTFTFTVSQEPHVSFFCSCSMLIDCVSGAMRHTSLLSDDREDIHSSRNNTEMQCVSSCARKCLVVSSVCVFFFVSATLYGGCNAQQQILLALFSMLFSVQNVVSLNRIHLITKSVNWRTQETSLIFSFVCYFVFDFLLTKLSIVNYHKENVN